MNALIAATALPVLVPSSPTSTPRDPSRLLRNGLAVVSYSAFEDFFTDRCYEALSALDSTRVPFTSLPTRLREAATVNMVRTITFRMAFESAGGDRRKFVQEHSEYIYSTASSGYRFSPLTFAPSSSNVGESDLEGSLKSLLVDAPWSQLTSIASRIGYGGVGLKETLSQLSIQRNEAAHAADADVAIADLIQMPYDLLSLAIAFDALFSWSIHLLLKRGPSSNPDSKFAPGTPGVEIVFLDPEARKVAERIEGRVRATKLYSSLSDALIEALPRAVAHDRLLVIRDEQLRPIDWRTTWL
jgi:hypothetical protein